MRGTGETVMLAILITPTQNDSQKVATPARLPSCPCCAGALVMLREMYRCARCQYSICVGCETAAPENREYD
jgi:hypothetical protein